MDEKRKYSRLPVSFPVECTELPSQKYFFTVTKDLSLGGAKIISENFLTKDSPVKVNVNLIDKVIDLEAKIAWCNQEPRQLRFSAGLEFKNINDFDKRELSRFIESVNKA